MRRRRGDYSGPGAAALERGREAGAGGRLKARRSTGLRAGITLVEARYLAGASNTARRTAPASTPIGRLPAAGYLITAPYLGLDLLRLSVIVAYEKHVGNRVRIEMVAAASALGNTFKASAQATA